MVDWSLCHYEMSLVTFLLIFFLMIVLGIAINTLIYNNFIQINTTYSSNTFPASSPSFSSGTPIVQLLVVFLIVSHRGYWGFVRFSSFLFLRPNNLTHFHVCWFFPIHYWNMLLSSFGAFFYFSYVLLISKYLLVSFF